MFQCFYQLKLSIVLAFLVILVFKMFDTSIWWISWFLILSIYKFYPYLSKVIFFWERENGCFFFAFVVWTIIYHTALKNHLMYILLQQSLNLLFIYYNIIMLIYFMSQPNVSYFHSNSSMKKHSQKQHNKKRKNSTRRKDRCSFVYE